MLKTTCLLTSLLLGPALLAAEARDHRDVAVANLLAAAELNAGFETAPTGTNGGIPGWLSAHDGNNMKIEVVAGGAFAGARSLKFSGGQGLGVLKSTKLIEVEPGYKYFMSARGKFHNVYFAKSHRYGAGFGLWEIQADRETVNANWYDHQSHISQTEGGFDWRYTEFGFGLGGLIPKENTKFLRVVLYVQLDPGGEVQYDDIRVWKVKIEDRKVEHQLNVVENHSFELRYRGVDIPNGYAIKNLVGDWDLQRAICVTDETYDRAASLRLTGNTTVSASRGSIDTSTATIRIAVKTENGNVTAFARLVLLDRALKVIKTETVCEQTGATGWKVYEKTLPNLPPAVAYLQWEFGTLPGSTGHAWFDDLRIEIPSQWKVIPKRELKPASANVTVDCSAPLRTFTSPLNGLNACKAERLYSPTVGSRGPFMEGDRKWFEERPRLGFRYLRVQQIFNQGDKICVVGANDGKFEVKPGRGLLNSRWTVSYIDPRLDDRGKRFPGIVEVGPDGKLKFDFSAVKYLLDKHVLIGGIKPIIDCGLVPQALAIDGLPNNSPKDFKQWEELNYRFAKFLVDTYGKDEVSTWLFETGNEPSTEPEFHGDPRKGRDSAYEEFLKLQDYGVAGLTRAFPEIFIAGPGGPPEAWIVPMLEHCATGKNYATGKVGTKIDGLSYHGYLSGDETGVTWRPSEDQALRYKGYAERYRQLTGKSLLVYNGEVNGFYIERMAEPSHVRNDCDNHVQAIAMLQVGYFSHRHDLGPVCYFFEHPNWYACWDRPAAEVPEFTGNASAVTFHGIIMPVARAYQMMAMLNGGMEVQAEASNEPVWALATTEKDTVKVLCYSLDSNPNAVYTTQVSLAVKVGNLGKKFTVTKFELSDTRANSWYLAKQLKLTQQMCADNPALVDQINRDSELKPEAMGTVTTKNQIATINFGMKSYSAVLFVLKKVE
jgi:hypothetical protein